MPLRVICHGGACEIGGNKILIEDKDTKVLLDFGAGFSEGIEYFSAGIKPRTVNGAGDYFEFGLLPEIEGLYSEDALANTSIKYVRPEVDAVFVSHFHLDHTSRIEFVDPDIPVYCGETTKLIHEAYDTFGTSPLRAKKKLLTFRTGSKLKIGNLEVVPIHVDHSIPGAYGFLIFSSAGTIVYTGDFRFHGPQGSMTEQFLEEAVRTRPLALISEGTRVSTQDTRRQMSEADVVSMTCDVLESCKKFVFSSFRGNDIDRINSFYKACMRAQRTFVVSTKTAVLLEKLKRDSHLHVPEPAKDVEVYVRRKKSGKFDDRDYSVWERKYLDVGLTCEEIRKKQERLFLHLDIWNLPEMIDIKPEPGGAYIHSSSEAFNEEGEEEEEVVRNWVSHFGFSYNQIHASGHATAFEVEGLVRNISAQKVIPIHTDHPELFASFKNLKGKVVAPKKGVEIHVA